MRNFETFCFLNAFMTRLLFVLFLVLGFLGVDFASQHSAVSIPAISVLSNKDKLQPYNESWKWNSFTRNDPQWVDSVYNTLAQDERLGQMFMVAAFSNKGPEHISYIDSLILNQKIGGLIFFKEAQ